MLPGGRNFNTMTWESQLSTSADRTSTGRRSAAPNKRPYGSTSSVNFAPRAGVRPDDPREHQKPICDQGEKGEREVHQNIAGAVHDDGVMSWGERDFRRPPRLSLCAIAASRRSAQS